MRKSIFLFFFTLTSFMLNAQCVIDTTVFVGRKYAFPDTMPCAINGQLYDTTVQVKLPRNVTANEFFPSYPAIPIRVDSVLIDSITNLPDSLEWSLNPSSRKIYAPGYACFGVYGKTSADTGTYNVGVWGTIWFNVLNKDTFQKGDFAAVFPVSIKVINQGDDCYGSRTIGVGIETLEDDFATVYPNPFDSEISIDMKSENSVDLLLTDALGKVIYKTSFKDKSFKISTDNFPLGYYVLTLKTLNSTYSKSIVKAK